MKMEVEVISRETIKPSKPTPSHLKSHPLSRLDLLLSVYEYRTPFVVFYPNIITSPNHNFLLANLKHSLSKTLSLFYPLAGRIKNINSTAIDCNDAGVPLLVARATCNLTTFLRVDDRVDLVPKFIPNDVVEDLSDGWVPLAVQITVFECGGFAIGSHLLHKTIDGISRTHFLKTWAAFARGRNGDVLAPDFATALSVFPPSPGPGTGAVTGTGGPIVLRPVEGGGKGCSVRAFEFSGRVIKELQSKGKSDTVPYPTRVEAVSGFLWKHMMAAAVTLDSSPISGVQSNGKEHNKRTSSALIHAVDMRSHIRPPLPPTTFGKFTTHAIAQCDQIQDINSIPFLSELVAQLHKVLSETKDFKFISKFIGDHHGGDEAVRQHAHKLKKLKQDTSKTTYGFTSWSNLDVDFGSGMPVWLGFTGGKVSSWFKNYVTLIHTPDYGIAAWVILDEQEMAILESDSEFLAFASPSASASTGLIPSLRCSL